MLGGLTLRGTVISSGALQLPVYKLYFHTEIFHHIYSGIVLYK